MNKLASILAPILEMPAEKITENISMENCESWTSLALVRMLEALENAYDIELDVEDAIEMDSVAAIKNILEEKGVW